MEKLYTNNPCEKELQEKKKDLGGANVADKKSCLAREAP
jgi:hypothetical protein